MRVGNYLIVSALCAAWGLPGAALAQDATAPAEEVTEAAAPEDAAGLLTQAELETLMAPVALYPDTLLIQILVAATYPLEIVKSDRFLSDNVETDPDTLKTSIEAEGWDPSVTVLATAFPDVIGDMAEHVEWTDAVGTAMLAQSEDVLNAVQTLRDQAIETGALISGEAQTVSTDEDENVVITPADPEVVYVPQYDPEVVYDNTLSDALVTGAVAFGTFAVIDAIFDDDDDWDDYWGCRNCGGWGGGPIIRDPSIDIDVDGNVNIGNNLGNNGDRPNLGWKPDDARGKDAKDKIANKRGENGATKLPIDKVASRPANNRGDDLRNQLSSRSGAQDISRPEAGGRLPQIDRPAAKRPAADKAAAVKKTAARPTAKKKPAVKKPATKKIAAKPSAPKKSAIQKKAPSKKTKAASNRGKSAKAKVKARR